MQKNGDTATSSSMAQKVENKLTRTIEKIFIGGSVVLFTMMMATVADVVGRFLGHPILGVDELMGLLLVCLASSALAYSQIKKGHIGVEILTERFPHGVRNILDIVAYLFCLFGASLITWQTYKRGITYMFAERGQITQIMGIPFFPFTFILSLGFLFLAVIALIDLIRAIARVVRG